MKSWVVTFAALSLACLVGCPKSRQQPTPPPQPVADSETVEPEADLAVPKPERPQAKRPDPQSVAAVVKRV